MAPLNYLKKNHCWLQYLRQRIVKKGMVGRILLLPEFCRISDLSEKICSYFPITKDLFCHTQINSAGCGQQIQSFMNDHQANLEAQT